MKTKELLKKLAHLRKETTLRNDERVSLRAEILSVMAERPHYGGAKRDTATAMGAGWTWYAFAGRLSWVSAFAFVLFLSGGVAIAAQDSLPDTPLYAVKVAVTEPLARLVRPTETAKLAYDISLLERRIDEAVILAETGRLTEKVEAQIEARFVSQAAKTDRDREALARSIQAQERAQSDGILVLRDDILARGSEKLARIEALLIKEQFEGALAVYATTNSAMLAENQGTSMAVAEDMIGVLGEREKEAQSGMALPAELPKNATASASSTRGDEATGASAAKTAVADDALASQPAIESSSPPFANGAVRALINAIETERRRPILEKGRGSDKTENNVPGKESGKEISEKNNGEADENYRRPQNIVTEKVDEKAKVGGNVDTTVVPPILDL